MSKTYETYVEGIKQYVKNLAYERTLEIWGYIPNETEEQKVYNSILIGLLEDYQTPQTLKEFEAGIHNDPRAARYYEMGRLIERNGFKRPTAAELTDLMQKLEMIKPILNDAV